MVAKLGGGLEQNMRRGAVLRGGGEGRRGGEGKVCEYVGVCVWEAERARGGRVWECVGVCVWEGALVPIALNALLGS